MSLSRASHELRLERPAPAKARQPHEPHAGTNTSPARTRLRTIERGPARHWPAAPYAEPLSSATAPPLYVAPYRASSAVGGFSLVANVIPTLTIEQEKSRLFFLICRQFETPAHTSHLARLYARSTHCSCAGLRQQPLTGLQLRIMRVTRSLPAVERALSVLVSRPRGSRGRRTAPNRGLPWCPAWLCTVGRQGEVPCSLAGKPQPCPPLW